MKVKRSTGFKPWYSNPKWKKYLKCLYVYHVLNIHVSIHTDFQIADNIKRNLWVIKVKFNMWEKDMTQRERYVAPSTPLCIFKHSTNDCNCLSRRQ